MASLRRYNLLYNDTNRIARDVSVEPVLEVLGASLHLQVARHARRRLFMRAGVVAWGDRAIVILARPSTGTTSLVAALCSAGARYYSDMFAVFDSTGRVHAYAKPRSEAPNGHSAEASVAHPGPRALASAALPVALILDTAYHRGMRWRARTLSAGQVVLALLEYVVPGRGGPTFALRTLQRVAEHAVMLRGRRGEAREMIQSILERIDT
jgi:hypothetical protein